MPDSKNQTPEEVPATVLENEEVNSRLDKIDKDVREIAKQFKSIQQSLDAIYEDRDIIADVESSINKVRQLIVASDKKNEDLTKNITHTVEKTAEQIKSEVHVQTSEVKNTIVQKIVGGIEKSFTQVDKRLVKRPWYKRLLFWKKQSTVKVEV